MQNEYNCFFFIADWHSLTTHPHPDNIRNSVKTILAEYLACGIDPEKATIYLQSDVREIPELYLYLNMNAGIGELMRTTSFKDKARQQLHIDRVNTTEGDVEKEIFNEGNKHSVSAGLLTYPTLMAADIIIHKAVKVPVGKDQEQNMEMARRFARRFNATYGVECFPEPASFYYSNKAIKVPGLDAKERLEVMHSIFHPDGEPFSFDWKWLAPSGLSTKDFIAPSSFRFGNARMFGLGGKYGAVSFLQILSPELSDEMLADFLNTENGIVVNLHVQAIDQSDAIKTVKRKITDLDAMKIQEQKRAVRSGYDMDILPSDLATYGQDAKELLKTLQSRNERMFQLTFLVLNTADTRQKLENDVFWAAGIAQKYNCSLVRLDYQQEQGLMSSLPLGASHIQIERSLTTSSVAVFVPFVTQELFQGGDAMYYGINAKTGNMIMLDRKRARCPNGLKLGTPGSGKSMSCKSEILSVFLCTPDDVYICDPEAEYYPLVKRLHGQVVKLSPTSKNYVNPLDINLNYSEDENPLALKSDFVLSFCELVMGGKNGLEAIEKTVIDRAVQVIYRPYLANPKPENMPILADLHKALLDQHIPEADRVAQALDLYVSGSLNVFNHRTNIDIQNRIVAFDIKELGKQLKKIGMLIVQDQIWGRVTQNRSKGKATWYFCDEFHLLLREEQTAAFSCEIWKRFRKWGGIPTGATQNVKDLLSSPEIENILENSDFICLLNQASGDRKILAERLNISPQQLRYVDNSEPGEGLLIYENVILPFKNPIPKNTQLYQIMTTRLGEGATV